MDRTTGRFTNLMLGLHHIPDGLRDRISVKSFGVGRKLREQGPQRHGEFDEFPFWDPEFYEPVVADPVDDHGGHNH